MKLGEGFSKEWGLVEAAKLVEKYYLLAKESIEELQGNTISIIKILESGNNTIIEIGKSDLLTEEQNILLGKLLNALNTNNIKVIDLDILVNLIKSRISIIQRIAGIKHEYDISSYERFTGDFVGIIINAINGTNSEDNPKKNFFVHSILSILKEVFDYEIEIGEIRQIKAEAKNKLEI